MNPSEAQAYALAEALGLAPGEDPIATLEAFLEREGHADTLAAHRDAWARGAERTPHGEPIVPDFTPAARAEARSSPSP